MSNDAFRSNFAKLLEKAGAKAEAVVRKTAIELQNSMINMSPVDTGRFKGNWQAGIGSINTDTSAAPGSDAKGRTVATLAGWAPGQTIFLSNSMPYARVLEYGRANGKPGSLQAPNGFVRLTVQAYKTALDKSVGSIK